MTKVDSTSLGREESDGGSGGFGWWRKKRWYGWKKWVFDIFFPDFMFCLFRLKIRSIAPDLDGFNCFETDLL